MDRIVLSKDSSRAVNTVLHVEQGELRSSEDFHSINFWIVANPDVVQSRYHKISTGKRATLAFARQGAKERGESNDGWRRSGDSYSPRRHWCSMFKPDGEAWVRGLRTDV
jgi:hypothetical protein